MKRKWTAIILLSLLGATLVGQDLILRVRIIVSMAKLNEEVNRIRKAKLYDKALVERTFNDEIDQFLIGSKSDKALVRTYLEALILAKVGVSKAFEGHVDLSNQLMDLMTDKIQTVQKLMEAKIEDEGTSR